MQYSRLCHRVVSCCPVCQLLTVRAQIRLADVAQPQPWARRDAQVQGHSCQEPRLEQEWPHQSWPPPQVCTAQQFDAPHCIRQLGDVAAQAVLLQAGQANPTYRVQRLHSWLQCESLWPEALGHSCLQAYLQFEDALASQCRAVHCTETRCCRSDLRDSNPLKEVHTGQDSSCMLQVPTAADLHCLTCCRCPSFGRKQHSSSAPLSSCTAINLVRPRRP